MSGKYRFEDNDGNFGIIGPGVDAQFWYGDVFAVTREEAYSAASKLLAALDVEAMKRIAGDSAQQAEPVAYRVDYPASAGVGLPRFFGADDVERMKRYAEPLAGTIVPLYAAPAPSASPLLEVIERELARDYENAARKLMDACVEAGCPDGKNMAEWIREIALAASHSKENNND